MLIVRNAYVGEWPGIKHNEEVLFPCTVRKKMVGACKILADKDLGNEWGDVCISRQYLA
jgi:hypothetical protein